MKRATARKVEDPLLADPQFYAKLADRFNLPVVGASPVDEAPALAAKLQTSEGPRLKVVKTASRSAPFVPLALDPAQRPHRWKLAGDKGPQPVLARGVIVFYHGLRYWVERVPKSWDESYAVYISDDKIHPDATRLTHDKRESFCVHADLLAEAPQVTRIGAALPTVASAARQERAAKGIRDVDDEVAQLLRNCKDLDAVYAAAAEFLGTTVKDLKAKYGHLNPGQQRMNCGNKMRFKWKKDNGMVKS